jgi:hypothetical protein
MRSFGQSIIYRVYRTSIENRISIENSIEARSFSGCLFCCQLFVISFRGKILRCGSTICWRAQAAPEISKKSGNSPLVIKDKWRPANNDYAQPAIKRDLLN